jgi:spermidine synthase
MPAVPSQRVVLARHNTPTGDIQLQQRPLDNNRLAFEIIVDGVFLMASYNQTGERTLARFALNALLPQFNQSGIRVLVGGLGMGFTLQETLSADQVTAVDVVELSPYIIEWNQSHFAALNNEALSDLRVQLIQGDVYAVLEIQVQYHTILLDVDNGPSWLSHPANSRLYTTETLRRWFDLLVPGGCFAVWSAQREPEFLVRLKGVFSRAEEYLLETPNQIDSTGQFIYLSST